MKQNKGLISGFCIFPGYNWCGPGCSGLGPPVNDVDAACKAHDKCYRRFGPSCKCDIVFIRRIRPLINLYTRKGRHALLIYLYMKIQMLVTCGFTRR